MPQILSAAFARWGSLIGVACAYLIAGKLSYFSIIPPGYDAAFWPAAGVALAAILLYGYRVWPGILLGAFFVNASIPSFSSLPTENLISLLLGLVISVGATLQAVLGAYLVKRFAGFPDDYIQGKKIFLFFVYGGVLSALVNSTLSITALSLAGRTSFGDMFFKWIGWWAGDFLGILIFTPLMLVWLWPNQEWRSKRLVLTSILGALFLLTGAAVYFAKRHGYEELRGDFNLQASVMKSSLERDMVAHLNTLYSLERFFASSNQVDKQEFRSFVSHYADEIKSIQALSWNPIISDDNRQSFVNTMRLNGAPNFEITERDINNQRVPAPRRDLYVPIIYTDPLADNEDALGFDSYSDEDRKQVFEQAKVSADIAMTGPLTLVQGDGQLKGVIAVMPIYKKGVPHQAGVDREKNISSYVSLIFLIDKIPEIAFQGLTIDGLSYRVVDKSPEAGDQLLFTKEWDHAYLSTPQDTSYFGEGVSLQAISSIKVANRVWQFEVAPTKAWLIEHHHHYDQLLFLTGLLLTGIVGAFVWIVTSHEILLGDNSQDKARQSQYIAHLDRQRSLGAMAASLGHELNQPLTAIMTNTQVAQRSLAKGEVSVELLRELLDKVVYNTRRTHLIIEKIRGFIQPSQLERVPVDIVALVKDTLEFLTQDLMAYQIKIHFFIDEEKLLVLGDAIQFSQVLLNIYRNALEVLKLVEHRDIFISVVQLDHWVVLNITDSGPGFTAEALKLVATPFYTTKSTGLGLGLSISRDIIEQHNGQLLISNAEQGGACFEIRLPALNS